MLLLQVLLRNKRASLSRPRGRSSMSGGKDRKLLGAAFAVGCVFFLGGCPLLPRSSSDIQFWKNDRLVEKKIVLGPTTLSSAALGPVPGTSLPLDSIRVSGTNLFLNPVDNQGLPGPQREIHFFAADLAATNTQLRAIGAAAPVVMWDQLTSPANIGADLIVPWPPDKTWNTQIPYEISPVVTGYFWGVQFLPAGPPLAPTGFGSVKSMRVYQVGLCGFSIPFTMPNKQGLFDQISDQLFQAFSGMVQSPILGYSRVTALLDEGTELLGTSPNGGFFLYFWYSGSAGPGGVQTVQFTANYEYSFGLNNDGVVSVSASKNDLLVEPQDHYSTFKDALSNQLPAQITSTFAQQQTYPPSGSAGIACDAASNDPTAVARTFFAIAAAGGGKKLGVSTSDQKRLSNAISNPIDWSCDQGIAHFHLRAKRINVYSDAIELVWFDNPNVDDPMVALYAASVYKESEAQLCSRPRAMVGAGPRFAPVQRPIVTVSRP